MKKIYSYFLLFLFLNIHNVSGQWTQEANVGGGDRYNPAGFSIGDKGYIGVGYNGSMMTDFWQYDPATGTWTQMADFGGPGRYGATSFSIGAKGYIGLGTISYPTYDFATDFWEYDQASNSWTQKGNFPGHGRYCTATFTIDSLGYMGTGWDQVTPYYRDFWQYDPSTDTWTQKADFGGTVRNSASGFAVNGKGYILAGADESVLYNDLWEYDPAFNTWTPKASFPGTPKYAAVTFLLCNYVYFGLGSVTYPTTTEVKDFWRYDPSADSWIQIADFPGAARRTAIGFSIGDTAYIGNGGADGSIYMNDFWAFICADSPPTASFQSSDSTICSYNCINYTDLSTNATSWQWSFTGATPASSTVQNPQSICYFVPGNYNVTLIVSNGGGSDTLTLTNYIKVNASPPTPVIIQKGDTLSFFKDPSYISYQWFYYNTPIPGATDTSFIAYYSGNYNVKVTNDNGCSIAVGITIVLGLEEVESNPSFSLYPNPVSNELTISILKNFHKADIEINDMLGRKIFEKSFDSANDNKLTIDLGGIEAGIYFISVSADGNKVTKKVIKE